MTLLQLIACCEAEVVVNPACETAIICGYTSDLLSDVMAHAPEGCVLITVQNHLNTVAVATLVGCRAILVCHHREVPADMQSAATRERVAILCTRLNQFEASGRVAGALAAQ